MTAYQNMDKGLPGLPYGLVFNSDTRAAQSLVPYGAALFGAIGDAENVNTGGLETSVTTFSADLVTDNVTDMVVNGVAIPSVTFVTDNDTTMIAIANAIIGVNEGFEATVTGANELTIIAGPNATVTGVVTGGASQATISSVYSTADVFVGLSIFVQKEPGGYERTSAVSNLRKGSMWVTVTGAVQANASAYVTNTTGAIGASGDAVIGQFKSNAADGELAVVSIDLV